MSEPGAMAAGIRELALGAVALAVTPCPVTAALGIANRASYHELADLSRRS